MQTSKRSKHKANPSASFPHRQPHKPQCHRARTDIMTLTSSQSPLPPLQRQISFGCPTTTCHYIESPGFLWLWWLEVNAYSNISHDYINACILMTVDVCIVVQDADRILCRINMQHKANYCHITC